MMVRSSFALGLVFVTSASAAQAQLGPTRGEIALGTAVEANDVPVGSIDVTILDESAQPVPGAEVYLGIRTETDERTRIPHTTDANGHTVYASLATGTDQSYRVNLLFEGAQTSSPPFQLPPHAGYRVRITRLPTTTDPRSIAQGGGEVIVELDDDRAKVTVLAAITNRTRTRHVVLPAEGLVVPLPRGAFAFDFRERMGDQRAMAVEETSFRIQGSFPPGTTRLEWHYALRYDGDRVSFEHAPPWEVYAIEVQSDGPPGVELEVSGLPAMERVRSDGRALVFTGAQADPRTGPLSSPFRIQIRNVPRPGATRWVALIVAFVVLALGTRVFRWTRPARTVGPKSEEEALLARAQSLADAARRGAVGPKNYAKEREELVRLLARSLAESDHAKSARKP